MVRRLVAAWRRLFAPAPPSPAMEEFLGWLAQTPYRWYIASNGKIRAREQGAEMCAVTGVVRHRAGVIFGVGDWVKAAEMIGLTYLEAGLVVTAADFAELPCVRMNHLRLRLLAATRIESSPAPPPAAPDPMDRALADLIANSAGTDDVCRPPVEQESRKEGSSFPPNIGFRSS